MRGGIGSVVAGLLCLISTAAYANGRLPGATGLAIHPLDERQLLLGLTYGLALSRDGGASWTWMCEEQIEGNGGDVDPSIVVTGNGTLVVLSLTNGGVLLSRNEGCTFERALGPLQGHRGVDLTLDPSQPGRVLALLSTISEVTDAGHPRYRNLLAHSLDHGASWQVLAELPEDLSAETVEVAPSDARRIYVSGTSNEDPLQGIVERSDDGGISWTRHTVRLPHGSGSLFLSGIHPTDPDRLWFRVPGRGDIYGVLPARLWLTTDGAASFQPVADTARGMLGFAVSPSGDRVVFGGPFDGLFIAPADASAAPVKVSDMQVGCLRWRANGLYVCTGEPAQPYSLGFATEPTEGFVPLWQRADTCRGACAPDSTIELNCRQPWQTVAPLAGAVMPLCDGRSIALDGGVDAGSMAQWDSGVDAGPFVTPPAVAEPAGGCAVARFTGTSSAWLPAILLMIAAARLHERRRQRRSKRSKGPHKLAAVVSWHRESEGACRRVANKSQIFQAGSCAVVVCLGSERRGLRQRSADRRSGQ